MVDQQETFLISRRSRMAKTVTFWPWWQAFNSFCFETLFFLCFSFLFVMQKSEGPCPLGPPPVVVGPEAIVYYLWSLTHISVPMKCFRKRLQISPLISSELKQISWFLFPQKSLENLSNFWVNWC